MAVLLTLSSVVYRAKEQVSCEVGSEAAVLNLANGAYYGLDAVGAWIWRMLAAPRTVGQIRDALLEKYDVASESCERDLRRFLSELAEEHLIEVRQSASENSQAGYEFGDGAAGVEERDS